MAKKPKINTTPLTGEMCKQLRKALQLNQKAFWDQVAVTQSGGSRYESGRELPEAVEVLARNIFFAQPLIEAINAVNGRRNVTVVWDTLESNPNSDAAVAKVRKALGLK